MIQSALVLMLLKMLTLGIVKVRSKISFFCQNFQNFGPKLALTVCGFRQWVEHFQSGLSEWLEKWEIERLRKEKEAREAALAAAREVKGVTVDLCFFTD